jgi:dTDP-4-dehydrorhamnose reductase
MKVLILGASGMLGHKLYQVFKKRFEVFVTIRGNFSRVENIGLFEKENLFENIDVENIEQVSNIVEKIEPEYLINCVGIIKQLPVSKEIVKVLNINAVLPHQLAEIADKFNSKLITISTDCVFNGEKGMYSEEDFPDATDLYGKSKHLGEVTVGNHLTLRTSIIGRELKTSHSLVEWFLSNQGKKVRGFSNAIYSGFPTIIFAEILSDLMLNHKELIGLFHVSSEPIDKYELLVLVKKHFQIEVEIEKFEDFYIDRSLDSSIFRQITGFQPQSWDEMIKKMAEDNKFYSERD